MDGGTPAALRTRKHSGTLRGMRCAQDTALKDTRSTEGSPEPLCSKASSPRGNPRQALSTTRSVSSSAAADNSGSAAISPAAHSLASTLHDSGQGSPSPGPLVVASSSSGTGQRRSGHDGHGRVTSSSISKSASLPSLLATSSSGPTLGEDRQWSNSAGAAAAPARKQPRSVAQLPAPPAQADLAENTKPPQYIRKKPPVRKSGTSESTSPDSTALSENFTASTPFAQLLNPKSQGSPGLPRRGADPKRLPSAKSSDSASPSLPTSPPQPAEAARRASRQDGVPPEADASDAGPPPATSMALVKTKLAAAPQPSRTPTPGSSPKEWTPPTHTHESPEHLSTDEPDVLVPAHKYVYDVKTCAWKGVDTMLRVLHPNRGLSQGTMRVCFALEELDETGFSSRMVAKMFRHNISKVVESDYFNEGEAQCICGIFAEKFNRVQVPAGFQRHVVSFLQCETVRIKLSEVPEAYQHKRSGFFSYRTTDSADILFTMEPRLAGNFTKYTNNFGDVYDGFERRQSLEEEKKRHRVLMAVEAFSHFTLVESGGSMLVCDLQGVNDFLTDPQIHTEDGKGLGMGNMGQDGIRKWMEAHVCNEVCRAIMLEPLSKGLRNFTRTAENESRVSYYQILRAKLRSQTPVRPEDIIPLSKPLSLMSDDERLEYAMRLSALLSE
ncbi:elongation factor-2 kinase-like protein [Leishmania donovani]|uniref:Alpha-kinase family protein n=2 Tax=Leishmania donovani TaxID=5661 RepID=A0A504X4J8_LEIDO|nr:Alpha-kinase family protein [Leishmania donovani]CAJ1993849.1 elongation factor-2 kinase-like protein [Leishmania donovani]